MDRVSGLGIRVWGVGVMVLMPCHFKPHVLLVKHIRTTTLSQKHKTIKKSTRYRGSKISLDETGYAGVKGLLLRLTLVGAVEVV